MKSKLTFDFDGEFKPAIRATVAYGTDDVRDKLARGFIERLGYESNLCSIINLGNVVERDSSTSDYLITPQFNVYQTVILELCKLHPNEEASITKFINDLKNYKSL